MAYLISKTVKGNLYWYIVDSKRINGKVKQEVIEYIGNHKKLTERVLAAPPSHPQSLNFGSIKSYAHGAVYALYLVASCLGIPNSLDSALPLRSRNDISRSTSFVLAAIHRVVCPGSKMGFADWVKTTTLPYYLGFDAEVMTSQHFWDQMDGISDDQLCIAEDIITSKVLDLFPVDIDKLALDYTNYYTYIDTQNLRNEIAQRGKNKQKRNDLRQCSLAVVVVKDLSIPLYSHVYKGNVNDQTEFIEFTRMLKKRLPKESQKNITLVFDGGSNNKTNLENLDMHYVCGFSLHSCNELYNIPVDTYNEIIINEKPVKAFRLKHKVWGQTRECVLTYSHSLYQGQARELNSDIAKSVEALGLIKEKLANPKSRIPKDAKNLSERCGKSLKGKYAPEIIRLDISDGAIDFEVNQDKKAQIEEKYFGKKLTITDREDWSTEEIISSYYEQDNIEKIFKQSKDVHYCSIRPLYHWTDQKMKVHVFLCLLGLTLVGVLQKLMQNADIKISKNKLIWELDHIRESWVKENADAKKAKVVRKLEEMTKEQEALWSVVGRFESEKLTLQSTH